MNGETLERIRQFLPSIRDRWEQLLRAAPPTIPVSNPDAMVVRIPDSLAQIVRTLHWSSAHPLRRRKLPPARRCAHNPFRAYFRAGEQAVLEVVAPSDEASADDHKNDKTDVVRAFQMLARPDVDAFCDLCRKYRLVSVCRWKQPRQSRSQS